MDGNLILLVLDDNTGQWQPQTPNGYNKLILPGDIKAVIDDLISYSQMIRPDLFTYLDVQINIKLVIQKMLIEEYNNLILVLSN